jgi:hypothetical protein
MERLTGVYWVFDFDRVCAGRSAFSSGAPRQWRTFSVLPASPWIGSNSWLGQSFRPSSESGAWGKLSLLHGVC